MPLHNGVFDSMFQEKVKDVLGDLVGGIRGGRFRNDTNSYDNRTETPLLFLSRRCVSEEASWVDGRPLNLPSRDQLNNIGTDSFPDIIERSVIDSIERLDRDMAVSTTRLREGFSEEIRPVNKYRVVAVPGAAVVVCSPLVLGGGVWGENGGIAGYKAGRLRRQWA